MNKEMTPLEALKEFRNQQTGVNVYADELLDTIEKALEDIDYIKVLRENQKRNIELLIEENRTMKKSFEALEIIKKQKCIYISALKSSVDQGAYNQFILPLNRYLGIKLFDKLTQEEYDLLKEVLE